MILLQIWRKILTGVGFEPTHYEDTAALAQRLKQLGHPASMIVQMPIFLSRCAR